MIILTSLFLGRTNPLDDLTASYCIDGYSGLKPCQILTVTFSPTPTILSESIVLDLKLDFTSIDSSLFVSESRFILIILPTFLPLTSTTLSLGFIGTEFKCNPDFLISSKNPLEMKYSLPSLFFAVTPHTAKFFGSICKDLTLPQSFPLLS